MAYFVPTGGTWDTTIKDVTNDRYWKVLIDTDGDDSVDDITTQIYNNTVSGGQPKGSAAAEWTVKLRNSQQTYEEGDLAGAMCEIQAKVASESYITVFTGYVTEEGCIREKRSLTEDTVIVRMRDLVGTKATRRKTDPAIYSGYKICDTANTSTSLVHVIAGMMGLEAADLDVTTIDHTVSHVPLTGKTTAWKELQKIADQYLGTLYVRYDGKLRLVSRFETGFSEPSSEWTFYTSGSNGNVHRPWRGRMRPKSCTRCETRYNDYEDLGAKTVYKNTDDWNETTEENEIVVAAGDYWPGPNSGDKAQLKYRDPDSGEDYPLVTDVIQPTIGATGSGSDIECDGGTLTLASWNGTTGDTQQNPDSSEIILQNATGGSITITKFQVRASHAYRLKAENTVKKVDASVTDDADHRDLTIDGTYVSDQAQAHEMCSYNVEWGNVDREYYQITADWLPQIQKGALVTLSIVEETRSIEGYVEEFKHVSQGPMGRTKTELSIILKEEYTYSGTPEVVVQSQSDYRPRTNEVDAEIALRNTVHAQAAEPTANSVGDLWIDTDNDNTVTRWDGASWADVDRLQPGVITATEIAAGTITADEIAANTITADEIAANTITASEIVAGTITATELAADSVTASEILAGTITATELAADCITTAKIDAGAVTATEIASETITASEIAASTITADRIDLSDLYSESATVTGSFTVGSSNNVVVLDATDATYRLWVGHATAASAPFSVEADGTLYADSGTIGGWEMTATLLRSDADGSARVELNQDKNRVSIFDSSNEKVVQGYLDQLVAYGGSGTATSATSTTLVDSSKDWADDQYNGLTVYITGGTGSGQSRTISDTATSTITVSSAWSTNPDATSTYEVRWGASDYGFWAMEGDKLRIDGDAEYINGDWLISNDASYLIQDAPPTTIVRLGTYDGRKGLFVNESNLNYTDGDPDMSGAAVEVSADRFFVGNDTRWIFFDGSNLEMNLVSVYISSVDANVLGTFNVQTYASGSNPSSLTNPVQISTEDAASPSWGRVNHATELRLATGGTDAITIDGSQDITIAGRVALNGASIDSIGLTAYTCGGEAFRFLNSANTAFRIAGTINDVAEYSLVSLDPDQGRNQYIIGYGAGHSIFPNDLYIKNNVSGGEIGFRVDGGTPLVLDTAAATITGTLDVTSDLAVDTDTLYVDSTNHRVGIGTDSIDRELHILGNLKIENSGDANVVLDLESNGVVKSVIGYSLTHDALTFAHAETGGINVGTAQLVIKEGNVGIGTTSPACTLDVNGEVQIGGGYGSTGVTIESDGDIKTNGALTVDGTSTLTGNVNFDGSIYQRGDSEWLYFQDDTPTDFWALGRSHDTTYTATADCFAILQYVSGAWDTSFVISSNTYMYLNSESAGDTRFYMNYDHHAGAWDDKDAYIYFASDAYLQWDESRDRFDFSKHIALPNAPRAASPSGDDLFHAIADNVSETGQIYAATGSVSYHDGTGDTILILCAVQQVDADTVELQGISTRTNNYTTLNVDDGDTGVVNSYAFMF